ncbi:MULTISPECIES: hypothetical protein [unclassified Streptomyces]|uniref:hypothetical protein n=1 Tax=unclassified Streptomyces TaxID=2593676 RepID=UPI003814BF39
MVRDRDEFTKPDGQDPTPAAPATVTSSAPTAVQPVVHEQPVGATGASTRATPSAEQGLAELPHASAELKKRSAPPWRDLPWLTLLLAAGVAAALAFIAGALVEKHHLRHPDKPAAAAALQATSGFSDPTASRS